ncbi:recombinase family protein [Streptomyces sp. NPDC056178]|uniref:recombinase family protein n=1 Tax=Streptomyces sp. NPDC056178 TaxID=3345735 RepID=UPI0035D73C9F
MSALPVAESAGQGWLQVFELVLTAVGPEFLTGELKGSHDPSGIVFTVLAAMSGMEREYIRDRTLEGHESARKRGKTSAARA